MAGGEPPDVFYLNDNMLPDYARDGVLEPIGDKVDNPDDFYESLRESFTYEGTYYCPPKDFSTLQLVYNVDELAAANVKPPTTWQELADAARALTKPGRPGLVIGAEFYRWGVFMAQAGGWPTDDAVTKMTMDSPAVTQALQYVADLHKNGWAASPAAVGAGWGGEALGKGLAAMTIEGNWIVGAMANDFPSVKYAVAELPAGPAGKGTMAFSVCYGVAKASKNKDAAKAWIKFLLEKEKMVDYTQHLSHMLPATLAAYDDPYYSTGVWKTFKTALGYATAYPPLAVWGDIENAIVSEFKNVLSDYIVGKYKADDVKRYLDAAAKKVDEALQREK